MDRRDAVGRAAVTGSLVLLLSLALGAAVRAQGVTIDHTWAKLAPIPATYITQAKNTLHIAYGHTSHGSQLVDGMSGLRAWKGSLYAFNEGAGSLDIRDSPWCGYCDLGYYPDWVNYTRDYLNAHPEINVIIWSWCGQVSSADEAYINTYLSAMSALEAQYPSVKFVYMTGHLDGSGAAATLNQRNEQIRNYVRTNNKILYDFADIESYDPDGLVNYMEKRANDGCFYDSNGDGYTDDVNDRNWAKDWQNAHMATKGIDWYDMSPLPAHTQALNGNLKAYAAWALWARLAGWDGALPALSVGDASVSEGPSSGVTLLAFPVTLASPATRTVTADYTTTAGTAAADGDYVTKSGTVTFAAGQSIRPIIVALKGDADVEADETFTVKLSNASGATIGDDTGVGTILDDDPGAPAGYLTQYRLFHDGTKEHLYTTDFNEYTVLANYNWVQEGPAYTLFDGSGTYSGANTIPIYRLYHPGSRQHHWTTDWNEATVLGGQTTWDYEGIIGYCLATQAGSSVPLFRLVFPSPVVHLWTTDENEKNVISSGWGWVYEGVAGYVLR